MENREVPRRSAWFVALVSVMSTVAVLALAAWIVYRTATGREWLVQAVELPRHWAKPTDFKLRDVIVARRDDAMRRHDLETAADLNGDLAQEALLRARATLSAWLKKQNSRTKLFPRSREVNEWRYRDCGADMYGFLVQAALRVEPSALPALQATLEAEKKLAPPGELCLDAYVDTGEPVNGDHAKRIFDSSEYVKDGLLSVYEGHGDDPAAKPYVDRMFTVLDVLLAKSTEATPFGPIPGEGAEENGNVLQACSRLGMAEGRAAYAEMAARIADAVVQENLPLNDGLPATFFDYADKKVRNSDLHLRDHGNEIIAGLAEAYAMAVSKRSDPAWAARADRWAEPVAAMMEKVAAHGCNEQGLLGSRLDPHSLKLLSTRANDNWGYLLNGMYLFSEAARRHGTISPQRLDALEALADRIAQTVATQYGISWEADRMDGYADTLESALYVSCYRPANAKTLLPWVDSQIGLLFSRQQDTGLVEDTYLDGNFIRTALMYADQKRGGWRVEPFREDVRVGFAQDEQGRAVVTVFAAESYRGTLRPDRPRHETIMHLSWNWPRLNSWPEWFMVTDGTRVEEAKGFAQPPTPAQLAKGVPLDLTAGGKATLRLSTGASGSK